MTHHTKSFCQIAKSLAWNPFELIAIYIVLAYGFASLITIFAGPLTATEQLPPIYFVIFFLVMMQSTLLFQDNFRERPA